MKQLRRTASDLLGFDRRERRATFVLAAILVLLLFLRVLISADRVRGDMVIVTALPVMVASGEEKNEAAELFTFDPNTVTAEELMSLGLSSRQAATLINYRNAGARFRKPADIFRVYGIDSSFASELVPWIDIVTAGKEGTLKSRQASDEAAITTAGGVTEMTGGVAEMAGGRSGIKGGGSVKDRDEAWKNESVRPAAIIDLNRCDATDLEGLPGIGEVLSVRIIKYRDLLGGFVSPTQLQEVYGIDSATVDLIILRLTASGDDVKTIDLDTCSWWQMARHPYMGPEAARAIMKYRSLMGVSFTIDDLVRQRVISDGQAARIAPYVRSSAAGPDN